MRTMLARLFAGRNGIDQLNTAVMWGGLACWLLHLLLSGRSIRAFLYYVFVLAVGVYIFRALSRNISKRSLEILDELLKKYADDISIADQVLGTNRSYRSGDAIRKLVADMYYQLGVEVWGDQYDIVLGGGLVSVRSPGYLPAGEVTYGDLQNILSFDNDIVLCSVSGKNLKNKFFNSTHYAYAVSYGSYGQSVKNSIDPNKTYYVVVDTYTSSYRYNYLTEVARVSGVYARDLLAEYVKEGGLS